MRREFKLPDVGEGLTEAEIVRWHVKPGDDVKVNQIVVEIETAKSIVELPIPWDGVVAGLMAGEGETVDVGVPIIAVDTDGEGGAPSPGATGAAAGAAAAAAPAPSAPTPSAPAPTAPAPAAAAPVNGGTAPASGIEALADDMVPKPPAEGAVEPGAHGSPAPPRRSARRSWSVTASRPAPPSAARAARPLPATRPTRWRTRPAWAWTPRRRPPPRPRPRPRPRRLRLRPERRVLGRRGRWPSPPVRKLAKDLGVDLTTLTGTGPPRARSPATTSTRRRGRRSGPSRRVSGGRGRSASRSRAYAR
ncbi:hypothetical protein GCM10020001_038210 [Nonomuraea salmonea]